MKQVWAAYAVTDHLAKKAFVADVMLYDRLVIPVPAPDDHARWQAQSGPSGSFKSILRFQRMLQPELSL